MHCDLVASIVVLQGAALCAALLLFLAHLCIASSSLHTCVGVCVCVIEMRPVGYAMSNLNEMPPDQGTNLGAKGNLSLN